MKIHWRSIDCGDVKPTDNFTNVVGLITCEKCGRLVKEIADAHEASQPAQDDQREPEGDLAQPETHHRKDNMKIKWCSTCKRFTFFIRSGDKWICTLCGCD